MKRLGRLMRETEVGVTSVVLKLLDPNFPQRYLASCDG